MALRNWNSDNSNMRWLNRVADEKEILIPNKKLFMKNKLIIAAIILVVALLLVGLLRSCNSKKEMLKSVSAITNNRSNDSTGYYRDLYNTEHELRRSNIASLQVLLAMEGKKFDSVCERLKIKPKQLTNHIEVDAESRGSFTAKIDTVWQPDTSGKSSLQSIASRGFVYSDKYMWQRGTIDSEVHIEYSVRVPIELTKMWKRKHKILGIPFGAKTYYIDGSSKNESVHITGLKDYQVAKEKPRTAKYIIAFGVGVIGGLILSK